MHGHSVKKTYQRLRIIKKQLVIRLNVGIAIIEQKSGGTVLIKN